MSVRRPRSGREIVVGLVLIPVASLLLAATLHAAATAQDLYMAALSREQTVRAGLTQPDMPASINADVRALVDAYQNIVRRFPTSGYSDNALWQAGVLSIDAFKVFGQDRDRANGVRLLRLLASEYPSSSLIKEIPAQVARTNQPPTAVAQAGGPKGPPLQGRPIATIRNIRRELRADTVRVTIELDREVPFHEERIAGPERVFVDLPSTRASASFIDRTLRFDADRDIVRQIRIGRHPDNRTRVVLDATDVLSYSVYPLYEPYRLVIDCVRVTPPVVAAVARVSPIATTAKPAAGTDLVSKAVRSPTPAADIVAARPVVTKPVVPRPLARRAVNLPRLVVPSVSALAAAVPVAPSAPVNPPPDTEPTAPLAATTLPPTRNVGGGYSMARQLGLSVSRIVIDPGHGGHDPGAHGNSIDEAELVLDIALRVEKLLQKLPGVEVILTRRSDDYVPLPERTAIANREGADLFLSIHANASNAPSARGVETYFLNFANNMSAASVAARENAASGQAMGALPDFLKAIALNNKIAESRDFAVAVQEALVSQLQKSNKTVKDLGVKQAPFVVLIGAAMPSVLAEISFLTNSQEAKLLRGNAYRQRIAEALVIAIQTYQTSLHNLAKVAQER
jgi:N-acetylmuramoyl-L-alanine amidase